MRAVLSFFALFATWLLLSGHYDPFFLASGAALSAFVVLLRKVVELFGSKELAEQIHEIEEEEVEHLAEVKGIIPDEADKD